MPVHRLAHDNRPIIGFRSSSRTSPHRVYRTNVGFRFESGEAEAYSKVSGCFFSGSMWIREKPTKIQARGAGIAWYQPTPRPGPKPPSKPSRRFHGRSAHGGAGGRAPVPRGYCLCCGVAAEEICGGWQPPKQFSGMSSPLTSAATAVSSPGTSLHTLSSCHYLIQTTFESKKMQAIAEIRAVAYDICCRGRPESPRIGMGLIGRKSRGTVRYRTPGGRQ